METENYKEILSKQCRRTMPWNSVLGMQNGHETSTYMQYTRSCQCHLCLACDKYSVLECTVLP